MKRTFICGNPECKKSFGAPSAATKARCPYCNTVAEVAEPGSEEANLRLFNRNQFLKRVRERGKRLWQSGAEFKARCSVCTASIPELGGSVLEEEFLVSDPNYVDALASHMKRLGWLSYHGQPNAKVRKKVLDLIHDRSGGPYMMLCQACLGIVMEQVPEDVIEIPYTKRLTEAGAEKDDDEGEQEEIARAAKRQSVQAATSSDMLTALEAPEEEPKPQTAGPNPHELAARRNALGVAMGKQGNYAAAVKEFQAAVEAVPNSPSLHLNLGIALAHVARDDKAMEEFRRVLELDPLNTKARRCLKKVMDRMQKPEGDPAR
ncbi:MAG TPA: tetratricopeptide repeat protein [Candidatus Brocadiia bacterium]|nr:tetratricopeptide repeat protein [Candidatus Brocadiia bacterium]